MRHPIKTGFLVAVFTLLASAGTQTAIGQASMPVILFKVITEKDEVLIGLNTPELQALGGPEKNAAGAVARALADRKALTVWQYAVRKASNGDLQVAPLHQIGLLASNSLRVEPYTSPLAVLPHE
jgi:hypothetical protein